MFTGKINLIDANSYGQPQKVKEINLPEISFSINIPDYFDIEDINDPIFKTENYMNFFPNLKDFLLSEGSVIPISSFNLDQDEAIYESFVKSDLGLFLITKCESISMNDRTSCSKEQLVLKIFKISDKQLLSRLDLEDIKKDKIVYIFFGDNKIFIITHGASYSRREYQLFVIDVSQVSSPKIENKLTIKSSEDLYDFFYFWRLYLRG